ncbi:MAG TPA: cytochrome c oxidase subunit 3 [Longimicrobiales bacterium]
MMDRPAVDVSHLPTESFGHRSIVWWGTVGFMVSEGATLAIAASSYLYLRGNETDWPPPPTPLPDLLLPTINVALLLLSLWVVHRAKHHAMRFEKRHTGIWMMICTAVAFITTVLRGFEFASVNTSWDDHAYGSLVWLILGLHGTLILTDLIEGGVIGSIFFTDRCQDKHFSDVEDVALYKWFLVLSWVILYFLIYLSPRLM